MKNKICAIHVFLIISGSLAGYELRKETIPSAAMNTAFNCIITIPDSYHQENISYPVIYLLHGYGGGYADWSKHMEIGILSDTYNLIIVCPDGGSSSWYLDSPVMPESQYKTYVGLEVVAYVDNNFRTLNARESRAITGLSMGGHGALYLALEFPYLFGAAGSMSGVLELESTSKKYELAEKIGSYEEFPERWSNYSILSNASRFAELQTHIIIDCGVDDVFYNSNKLFHVKLKEFNIAHTFIEKAGGHSWEYWVESLEEHVQFFDQSFYRK